MTKTSLDKDKIKILLLEGIHSSAAEKFQADGYCNIEYHQKALRTEELVDAAADAYFVGIRSATQLGREFFENASRLTGVGCFCIGTNQVDLAAAEERGIPVFNAPFSNTRSVAELVLAEIILLLRGIPQRNAAAHRGGWLKTATGSHEVRGKTLGIVGYGHIGTQVGVLAESLGHAGGVPRYRDPAGARQRAAGASRWTRCWRRPMWSRCTCRKPRPPIT